MAEARLDVLQQLQEAHDDAVAELLESDEDDDEAAIVLNGTGIRLEYFI